MRLLVGLLVLLAGALPAAARLPSLHELVEWRFPDARPVQDRRAHQVRYVDPEGRVVARVATLDDYTGDSDLYGADGPVLLRFRADFTYWPVYRYLDGSGHRVAVVRLTLGEGGGEVHYHDGTGREIDEWTFLALLRETMWRLFPPPPPDGLRLMEQPARPSPGAMRSGDS